MVDGSGFCDKPDRDAPKTRCGYPMPCPWHTFVLDAASGIVLVPVLATPAQKEKVRIIAETLKGLKP